jgi:hypothetical protein
MKYSILVRCRYRTLFLSQIDLAPAEPALTVWIIGYPVVNVGEPIGISQDLTGHRAPLVILGGTVPHNISGHDSSQMAKLCFSPAPRKNLNLVAP